MTTEKALTGQIQGDLITWNFLYNTGLETGLLKQFGLFYMDRKLWMATMNHWSYILSFKHPSTIYIYMDKIESGKFRVNSTSGILPIRIEFDDFVECEGCFIEIMKELQEANNTEEINNVFLTRQSRKDSE